MKRQWKRTLSIILSVAMLFSMTGMNTVFALEGGPTVGASGLCEHHRSHTADCGYTEGTPEVPCAHEHMDDCYKEVTKCIHDRITMPHRLTLRRKNRPNALICAARKAGALLRSWAASTR